jgi:hypothetical protein
LCTFTTSRRVPRVAASSLRLIVLIFIFRGAR